MADKGSTNFAFIILITLVATIGGFLFGYDSGVINGTVDGLQKAFHSDSAGTGFNVASILLGCAAGAFMAGWLADKFGRRTILIVAALCFTGSAFGAGHCTGLAAVHPGPRARWSGRGRRQRARPRLHQRGRAGQVPWRSLVGAADRHHHRPLRLVPEQLHLGRQGWRLDRDPGHGLRSMALDVLGHDHPVGGLLSLAALHPRESALPGGQGQEGQGPGGVHPSDGRRSGCEPRSRISAASLAADHHGPKLTDILDSRSACSAPSCGWASAWPASSSSWASTSSSITVPSSGSRPVSKRAMPLLINVISGAVSIVACLFATALIDRVWPQTTLAHRLHRYGPDPGHPGRRLRHGAQHGGWLAQALRQPPVPSRSGRRQPVCRVLQLLVGPGHVGHVGRDVPQPDPRFGPGHQRPGAVAVELRHHHDLPHAC